MYARFKSETLPLKSIMLDYHNPRIVTPKTLTTQEQIMSYLFEHEGLENFITKIATEGKNAGAEKPYVVKEGQSYIVVEGNTRIAAYKILTGIQKLPSNQKFQVPSMSALQKKSLLYVDCTVAPNRDALLPIMASAHFGRGDKTKWGWLGSRKAIYDEWKSNKTVKDIAKAFNLTQGDIRDLILEFQLYQKAFGLSWTQSEKLKLLDPALEFNPPVRFLQTSGHKEKVGVDYNKTNLTVQFADAEAKKKFKHLILKLVISPVRGLGATASYEKVFKDYESKTQKTTTKNGSPKASASNPSSTKQAHGALAGGNTSKKANPGALFSYAVSVNNALIKQLMKEAEEINCLKFPASATFLLRNVVEAVLKQIIDTKKANPAGNTLDLEKSLNLCRNQTVNLNSTDVKILKEFQDSHLLYLNLGAHGNLIPNTQRVFAARDCIDQFVKRNV